MSLDYVVAAALIVSALLLMLLLDADRDRHPVLSWIIELGALGALLVACAVGAILAT
jgi:uncharacterized membrane protein YdjX (TVP38/TMEM64 family)